MGGVWCRPGVPELGNGLRVLFLHKTTAEYVYDFSIMSKDIDEDVPVTMSTACPNICHADAGQGYSNNASGKRVGMDGLGGVDCVWKFYHNGRWIDGHIQAMRWTFGRASLKSCVIARGE